MIKIGVTGKNGFVGNHLINHLGLFNEFLIINFNRNFYSDTVLLQSFVKKCDVIVHLSGINRHENIDFLYETNIRLALQITEACIAVNSKPHIIFSSSVQESQDNKYGASKLKSREVFEKWANLHNARLSSLLIPNVYGPFGKPNYNSVVATFCDKIINKLETVIIKDNVIDLIYVHDLVEFICDVIKFPEKFRLGNQSSIINVPITRSLTVSAIQNLLLDFYNEYVVKLSFPNLDDNFNKSLFNTFRSYLKPSFFPALHKLNIDDRGMFVEFAKSNSTGQSSFSTTKPGITRGNHFHRTKVERFTVIKGEAEINLRRIGTDKVIKYNLNGRLPSYVDMPIWYTHNIKNIGDSDLITLFWINEPFDPDNPDTYWQEV